MNRKKRKSVKKQLLKRSNKHSSGDDFALYDCHYCGNLFRSIRLTIDHKSPKSKGGNDEYENLCLSCSVCNNLKSDNYYTYFLRAINEIGISEYKSNVIWAHKGYSSIFEILKSKVEQKLKQYKYG